MRVHNPTIGEVADRLSILFLKIRNGEKKGVDVSHFIEEEKELWDYLGDKKNDGAAFGVELLGINRVLWELMDKAHDFGQPDKEYAELSKEIVRLNDERARKIEEINERYFPGKKAPEKIY